MRRRPAVFKSDPFKYFSLVYLKLPQGVIACVCMYNRLSRKTLEDAEPFLVILIRLWKISLHFGQISDVFTSFKICSKNQYKDKEGELHKLINIKPDCFSNMQGTASFLDLPDHPYNQTRRNREQKKIPTDMTNKCLSILLTFTNIIEKNKKTKI